MLDSSDQSQKFVPNRYLPLLKEQKKFFSRNTTYPLEFRIRELDYLEGQIKAHESRLVEALQADLLRPKKEIYESEITPVLQNINTSKKNLKKWIRPVREKSSRIFPFSQAKTITAPRGVALILTPYNFPISASFNALTASIAAGNCSLLRPSKKSPSCFAVIQKIINETFSPEHIAVIDSDHFQTQSLLSKGVDFFYFMGSRSNGLRLAEVATSQGLEHRLHLSGKCPVFIGQNNGSYLDTAVKRILWAKMLNMGQSCTAPEICFVPKNDLDQFVDLFAQRTEEFYGTQPMMSSDIGRLRSELDVERLAHLISPTEIVFGGQYSQKDRYFSPTLVTNVTEDMKIYQEEIFGPVLILIPYTNWEESFEKFCAISSQALSAYLFSDQAKVNKLFLEAGQSPELVINDVMIQGVAKSAPVGGRGHFGFKTFSKSRFVFENTLQFEAPGRLPPYREWMEFATRKLLPWL